MTDKTKLLLARLTQSCEMQTSDDIDTYSEVIAELRNHQSPDVLITLLRSLRDVDAGEVQYELVEACEAYPLPLYIASFVDEGSRMGCVAPVWFGLMLQSILNTNAAEQLLIQKVKNSEQNTKAFFISTLTHLAGKAAKYRKHLRQLET